MAFPLSFVLFPPQLLILLMQVVVKYREASPSLTKQNSKKQPRTSRREQLRHNIGSLGHIQVRVVRPITQLASSSATAHVKALCLESYITTLNTQLMPRDCSLNKKLHRVFDPDTQRPCCFPLPMSARCTNSILLCQKVKTMPHSTFIALQQQP